VRQVPLERVADCTNEVAVVVLLLLVEVAAVPAIPCKSRGPLLLGESQSGPVE
jgi:hypothetical protein